MSKNYLYLLFITVSFLSCSQNLPLPKVETKNTIAIVGELTAEETPYIRAGQTIGISTNGQQKLELPENLTLQLKDEMGNYIQLIGTEDSLSKKLRTIPYIGNILLQPKYNYTLTAQHTTLGTASVTVSMPQPFNARLINTTPTKYAGEEVIKCTIQIDDPAGDDLYSIECVKQPIEVHGEFQYNGKWIDIPTNFLLYDSLKKQNQPPNTRYDTTFFNTYQREYMYTTDVNTDNLQNNTTTYSYSRILLKDSKFSGQQYTTDVYVRKNGVSSSLYSGQFVLMVKSVSKEYYQYLGEYEGIIGYQYAGNEIPASLKGNITNGVGIVGGVFKRKFTYIVDDLFPY